MPSPAKHIASGARAVARKETERLHDALAERENLLDEIRHRVRNNMQLVLGFIRLLDRHTARTEGQLAQASARIQALAQMQNYFYARPERVSRIHLLEFLRAFAPDFAQEAGLAARVDVSGEDAAVDVGKATSIGLAVAEAILNRAEAGSNGAGLRIRLTREPKQLSILIEDRGGARAPTALHAALLHQYARLIAATLEIATSDSGTKIVLRLPA